MRSNEAIRLANIARRAEGYLELDMPEKTLAILDRAPLPGHHGLRAATAPLPGDVAAETRSGFASRNIPLADRVRLLYLRGEALRELARYDEALLPLQRASVLNSENIHILLAIAWCQKRLGRVDLAIEALEAALRAEPLEPLVLYNLACYHSLLSHRAEALDCLSQALGMDPDYRWLIDDESDFDPIRNDPEFQDLTSIIV